MDLSVVKRNYIDYINNIILNNKVSHAYLVEIDDYDSDIKYVFDFIKMILCNLSYSEMLKSNNNIIKLIDNNNYPDITIISSDTSVIKKSQLLELQKEFSNKSMLDNKRIYIINEAEKLNSSSANTILKFLEEPEDDIIAFLITDNRYHVLDTIISRCQILSLVENSYSYEYNDYLLDILDAIVNPNNFFIKYNYFINDYFNDKNNIKNDLIKIENIILDYLNNSFNNNNNNNEYFDLLKRCDSNYLINIVSIIEDEIIKLDFNVNLKLWLDSLFSKFIGG